MAKRLSCILLALASVAALASAGDLETTLRKLSQDAGSAYVAPVVSAIGADLNGGWFHESPRPVWIGGDGMRLATARMLEGSFLPLCRFLL